MGTLKDKEAVARFNKKQKELNSLPAIDYEAVNQTKWEYYRLLFRQDGEKTLSSKGFKEFFEKEVPGNPLKAEYLIPIFIGELLEQGKMSVKVLKTNDTWYGMTYHEDVAAVKDSFKKMLENGVYKADLFSDL